jgi:polyhydroxybutyrate depolymerase
MRRALIPAILVLSCGSSVEQAASGTSGTGGSTASASSASSASGTASASSAAGTGGASSASSSSSGGGGGGGACAGLTIGPGDHAEMIQVGSDARTYRVHVPPSYVPTSATSLVLVFHGYTQDAAGIEQQTEMDPVSDGHGFIAVYPQGLGNSWNAGSCCGSSSQQGVDDVAFVGALLDKLKTEYCVDDKRVFSAGFSNGGMLSHRLACEMSDRIAAIGAVSGTLAIDTCTPARPVSVMHVHGTADFVVAYTDGGFSGARGVPPTIANWVHVDGCTDAMPTNVFKNGDASCDEYQACDAGTRVRLCTIDQGGHQWPGGQTDFLGNLSVDLDASEEIAKFFDAHPMP